MTVEAKTDGKDRKFFGAIRRRMRNGLRKTSARVGKIYEDAIKKTAPSLTGALGDSYRARGVDGRGGSVESALPYASYQDGRTGFVKEAVDDAQRKVQSASDGGLEETHSAAAREAG